MKHFKRLVIGFGVLFVGYQALDMVGRDVANNFLILAAVLTVSYLFGFLIEKETRQ